MSSYEYYEPGISDGTGIYKTLSRVDVANIAATAVIQPESCSSASTSDSGAMLEPYAVSYTHLTLPTKRIV